MPEALHTQALPSSSGSWFRGPSSQKTFAALQSKLNCVLPSTKGEQGAPPSCFACKCGVCAISTNELHVKSELEQMNTEVLLQVVRFCCILTMPSLPLPPPPHLTDGLCIMSPSSFAAAGQSVLLLWQRQASRDPSKPLQNTWVQQPGLSARITSDCWRY